MVRSHFLSQLGMNGFKFIQNRFNKLIVKISNNEYNDLCHLYTANRLEQHPRWPKKYKFIEYDEMKKMRFHLSLKAWTDLEKEYQFNVV